MRRYLILLSKSVGTLAMLCALALSWGCAGDWLVTKGFIAREEMVDPMVNSGLTIRILDSVGPGDDVSNEYVGAQDVTPNDLKVISADYIIGKNDLVTINVWDLINPGQESTRTARVSESGTLSLLLLREPVKIIGLTEPEAQRKVADAYREAGLLANANVTATVVEARQRTYYIGGAVAQSGQYPIVDSSFHLREALIQARDVTVTPDYVYVIRKLSAEKPSTQPSDTAKPPTKPSGDIPEPRGQGPSRSMDKVILAQASAPSKDNSAADPVPPVGSIEGQPKAIGGPTTGTGPVIAGPRPTTDEGVGAGATEPAASRPAFDFGSVPGVEETRIIRVPYGPLSTGDWRYNIVVRPNDIIHVPVPSIGNFYMGGHFARTGAYQLGSMKMTIKTAVISAGMLDPLAVPGNTYLIRRVQKNGHDEELYVKVDLSEIFAGRQPDVFLKPYDQVVVGTDFFAPWLSAIRGAFRFSYGFGFIYDRNFWTGTSSSSGGL